jgi:DNA-binding PadR family transcriptional regulator
MSTVLELSPTARVILGFLRFGARTGYDIKSVVEISTRFFWGASYGQIYPELKRLEHAGLVESEQSPHGARKRTLYSLTSDGERALEAWLTDRESWIFEYRDEWLLRLFFGDLLPPEDALANVRAARAFFTDAARHFRSEIEPHARMGAKEGERFPLLAYEFGLEFLEFAAGWYARVERRLSRQDRAPRARPAGTPARERR